MSNYSNDYGTKALKAINRLQAKRELWLKFHVLDLPCWAGDSNKIVIECSCPQCKEIVKSCANTGKYPVWME